MLARLYVNLRTIEWKRLATSRTAWAAAVLFALGQLKGTGLDVGPWVAEVVAGIGAPPEVAQYFQASPGLAVLALLLWFRARGREIGSPDTDVPRAEALMSQAEAMIYQDMDDSLDRTDREAADAVLSQAFGRRM